MISGACRLPVQPLSSLLQWDDTRWEATGCAKPGKFGLSSRKGTAWVQECASQVVMLGRFYGAVRPAGASARR